MEEIKAPKKERKFLKAIGNIGKVLAEELVMGIARKFIGKVVDKVKLPKKRETLSIFLLLSFTIAFAQFPSTGNKQRLGFQTTADGLVWRGSISDTAAIQPVSNQNAWVILDTVNLRIYSFDFTSNHWNAVTIDSTSISNLLSLKVNISDTATMLQNYALKYYVDSIANNFQDSINDITNGYFKQQFTSVTSDTLLWTRSVQLPTDENLLLAFRNGQILNNNQYTRIDTNKIKIAANTYKVGENYTIVYVKGGGGSIGGGSSFDTTDLNLQARLDLKLNISDTASMLANYATKAYADTSGRFYARQDFTNVSSSTLTWTQSDTLVVGGVNVVQVYRNGQILLPTQYTIPTNASVVIGATAFKVGENYTVIFPRGGGAGSGSGSLTSISGGTGITVSPNPITTTGTVSADLSVLMELTDTTLLNLTSRFATKQNNITLTTTGTSGASTLVGSTLNIPQYTGGSGTVTSVGSGYGVLGGPITTTGTLRLDSSTVYDFVRDSIVAVEIGGDTIKIIKQEYKNVTSDTLTFTIFPKFPIQLRQFILLFRNGQLLLNDQFSVIDTNKVKVAATSYKIGENYTLVTVSGIGSVSSAQANPIYPEAGIALSTGTTWASSITNNSSNWNTAYTDRLKWDGGSTGLVAATGRTSLGGTTIGQSMFTLTNPTAITFPRFNVDNSVSALSATDFRTAIGAGVGSGNGTVTSVTVSATSGNPLSILNTTTTPIIELLSATSGRNGYLTSTDWTTFNNKQPQLSGTGFVKASETSISYDNSTYLTTSLAASTYLPLTGGTLTGNLRLSSSNATQLNIDANDNNLESRITFSTAGSARSKIYTTSSVSSMTFESIAQASAKRGFRFISSTEGTQYLGLVQDPQGNVGIKSDATGNDVHPNTLYVNGTLGVTDAATLTNLAGSGTRMVTANSAGLLSTQAIPSGGSGTVTGVYAAAPIYVSDNTVSPYITIVDASQFVKGVVNETTQTFGGVKTFANTIKLSSTTGTSTSILGKTSDNSVSTVSVGTGLSLTSGTLSSTITVPTERYVWDLGIFAGAADNSAATWDPQYGINMLVVPTTLNGYCIDSIYARALTCSTCPPAAGDKDYYIGVYKAGNSTRIQTTGMSLQGSQIAMNEYDLKEVNVNYTLTTGDVWWLYLNGTYTSDMLYITGGFVIKKTCN